MSGCVLAIDPGPEESALVSLDGARVCAFMHGNEDMVKFLRMLPPEDTLVIERVEGFGMPVGREVFETVWWSGRFAQVWRDVSGVEAERLGRRDVKLHLCGTCRAKDGNVRQALIDRFGPGKEAAIGKKKTPGPLYGVSGDAWAALAVAVTWADRLKRGLVAVPA